MQRQRSVQRKTVSARVGISHPPQFTSSFVLKKRLRFQAVAAATATNIRSRDLGDLWCVATSAIAASQLASHVRLRKVEMWGPMSSSLAPVTVLIDWIGSTIGGFGKSNRVSDTSMGSTEPAHLVSRPPPGSQIAQWQLATQNSPICALTCPAGTIVDIIYDLVVLDDGTANAVLGAVAGATPGANYVRSLESSTGTNFPPISYSTI